MRNLLSELIFLFLCIETQANRHKVEIDPASLLPSSSLLHPLDFQDDWQASEPVPVDIFYKVPVNGEGDLYAALESANDAGQVIVALGVSFQKWFTLPAQRRREADRELQDQEYLRQQISARLIDARRTISTARF